MDATYENLNEAGYLVVPGVLSKEQISTLQKSLLKRSVDLIFTNQGFDVDIDDPRTPELFTDMHLREKMLGESGKTAVWKDGNTRRPIIMKSCGMVHIHYDEDLLENISYNPRLYEEAVKVMGTKHLVFTDGMERICIKAKGSTDMPKHSDSNFFNDSVNHPFRIQSLVTIQIDTKISPRDSGTLCVLAYFHKYWDFVRELLHPLHGLVPMKEDAMKSRFFVLPMDKKNSDHFDENYLPAIKLHAKQYSMYLETGRVDGNICVAEDVVFYKKLKKLDITVPKNSLGYLEKMNWTPVPMKPGDMVFWHQYLPHFSVRNKSSTPRICAYYGLYPVKKEWYGSEYQKWTVSMLDSCKFYYGIDAGNHPTKVVNTEEYEDLKSTGDIKRIAALSKTTSFRRMITGREPWGETKKKSVRFAEPLEETESMDVEETTTDMDVEECTPRQLVFETRYWTYAPGLIPNSHEIFERLLPKLEKVCETTMVNMYGRESPSKKVSVIYSESTEEVRRRADAKSKGFDYKEIPSGEWTDAPKEVLQIKELVENFYECSFDYVLCHIYRGDTEHGIGKDYIGWHNDKEALDSEIVSVSLGATRKFQLRPINDEKGYTDELKLKCGDVVHMYGPRKGQRSCQRKYKHQVPEMDIDDLVEYINENGLEVPKGRKTYKSLYQTIREAGIAPTRINMTFRQYQD